MSEQGTTMQPTERFSSRVTYYVQYRPRYPRAILPFLEEAINLTTETVIADIGSGTGFLAELFLSYGNDVFAVEPNDNMRAAADERYGDNARFHSVSGTAEQTTLPNNSIDLITAGQAFHWFEVNKTHQEFQRILRPRGWVALIYNSWNLPQSPVAADYRDLLDRYGTDYQHVSCQRKIGPDMVRFFGAGGPNEERFANDQSYDFDALCGRVLSSSYAPLPDQPNYEPLVAGLRQLYERHAVDGRIMFPYETTVYWGKPR